MNAPKLPYIQYNWQSDDPALITKAQQLAAMRSNEKNPIRRSKNDYSTAFNVILTAIEVFRGYRTGSYLYIPTDGNLFSGKTRRNPTYTNEVKNALLWLIESNFLTKVRGRTVVDGKKLPFVYALGERWLTEVSNKPISERRAIKRNPLADYVELRVTNKRKLSDGKISKTKHSIKIPEAQGVAFGSMIERTTRVLRAYDAMMQSVEITLAKESIYSAETSMTRIFSHGQLSQGGRFYCKIQNLKGVERLDLEFNSEPVVEVDFSSFHPRMLYHREGLTPPSDAYALEGYKRADVKEAFNIMLNSDKYVTSALMHNIKELDAPTARSLENAIKGMHSPIAHHFCTGVGLELQRLDSDIVLEILETFVTEQWPIIPIHDSALVRMRDVSALMEKMNQAYQHLVLVKNEGTSAFEVKCSEKLTQEAKDTILKELEHGDVTTSDWDCLINQL